MSAILIQARFYSYTSILILLMGFSANAGMNGYSYQSAVTGFLAPNASSNSATLKAPASGKWLGTVNSNWSNTANWRDGVLPTASTDVVISAAGNQPVADVINAVCNNLTICAGAALFISSGNTLDIKGEVTNNGSFTVMGEAQFSGSTQTLPAGIYTNLEISGSGTKNLAGSVTVNGTLTLTNGYLQLGNNDLSIGSGGNISNGSSSSFIITGGTGILKQANIGAGGRTGLILFPVGISSSSYTPISMRNAGTCDEFSVHVIKGIHNAYDEEGDPTGAVETNFNVDRTWILNETTPGGSNTTLSFQWNALDEHTGFIRINCFASHYVRNRWQEGPLNQVAAGTDPFTLSLANVTSFSPFGVGSAGSISPVGLNIFSGKPAEGGVQLQWQTENEWNFTSFEIQRSTDGSNYVVAGNVAPLKSTGLQDYFFTDPVSLNSTVYYRLKQIDTDNRFVYSPAIQFSGNQGDEAVLVCSNPPANRSHLTIRLSHPAKTCFSLYDNSRTLIRIWQQDLRAGSTAMAINLDGQAPGLYLLEVQGPNSHRQINLVKK
ncbi:MAG: hypothetical protein ABIN89_22255 [Chitinophagaceae bacterium]